MKIKGLHYLVLTLMMTVVLNWSPAAGQDVSSAVTTNDAVAHKQTYQEYMKLIRNNQLTGQINPADVARARKQVEGMRMLKNGQGIGMGWQEMGPDNLAGRTRAILVDKNNSQHVYAGAVTGGVWKSTTGGSSWVQMKVDGTKDNLLNVTCLAQGSDGAIYAGTGEGFYAGTGLGNGGIVGKGVYKSTDGENFTLLASTKPTFVVPTAAWAYVNRLAATAGGTIYAATNAGLVYSTDGGTSWNLAEGDGSPLNGNAHDVKVGSNGIIIASVGNKCYISENGDPNGFINHSTGAPALPLPTAVIRIECAIAPSNPDVIYVVAAKTTGALENIYRSTDKGQNWQIIGPGGSSNFNVFNTGATISVGQGLYDIAIAVLPDNPDALIVGGVNMWKGYKIDNGYFAWEQVSSGLTSPLFPLFIHRDHHVYVFSNNDINKLYIGCDGGVYISTDGIQTFQSLNKNYATTQCYSVAASHDDKVLLGTQDNGVQYIDKTGNTVYAASELISGEIGGTTAISFINPKVMIAGTTNGTSYRSVDYGANFSSYYASAMSNLSGAYVTPFAFWESFNDPTSIDSVQFISFDTIPPLAQFVVKSKNGAYPFLTTNTTGATIYPKDTLYVTDPVQTKLLLGTNGAVWFTKGSIDFANTPVWVKLASFGSTVQSMAISRNGDVLYFGTQDGLVMRLTGITTYVSDTSNDLELDTIKIFTGRAVTSVAIDPQNNAHIIVTLGNYGNMAYIYESTNALATAPLFTSKQGNLPAMPVYTSLIELYNSNRALIGTEMGIFSTTDLNSANPTWSPEYEGIGDIPVYMLRQQNLVHYPIVIDNDSAWVNNYGMIYAATHGRGIFKSDKFVGINEPGNDPQASSLKLGVYPNPALTDITLTYKLDRQENVIVEIYDLLGEVTMTREFGSQAAGPHLFNMAVDQLAKGTYFIRLTAGSIQLSNKLVVQ